MHLSVEILKSVNSRVKLNHAHSWTIEPRKGSDEVMFGEKQIALYQKRGVSNSQDEKKKTAPHFTQITRAKKQLLTLLIWSEDRVDVEDRASCFSTLTSLNLGEMCPDLDTKMLCCLVFSEDEVIRVFHIAHIQ